VVRTRVGFTGGTTENATYRNIGDHTEAVEVEYDPSVTSYSQLLDIFWAGHDPTVPAYSRQYMSAIFCTSEEELKKAQESLVAAQGQQGKKEIHTVIQMGGVFFQAEDYHQKYMLQKHPDLLACLGLARGPGLNSSCLATRLNGYVGGYGSKEKFLQEIPQLGLSDQASQIVLEALPQSRPGPACGL